MKTQSAVYALTSDARTHSRSRASLGAPDEVTPSIAQSGFCSFHALFLRGLLAKLGRLAGGRPVDDALRMLLEFCVVLLLVLANGLFAGAEIAIVGMERARLRQLSEKGSRAARAVLELRRNPERFFATVQIVITAVGASAGAIGGATFALDLAPRLVPLVGDAAAKDVAIAVVVAGVSYLSLVLGELVPKSLALRKSERYALWVAPVLVWVGAAARPLVWGLLVSSNLVLRMFGERATFAENRLTSRELRDLVEEAAELGSLDARAGEIASRALEFGELTAAKVMVPRRQVVGVPLAATTTEIRAIVLESAHSRLPVYDGTLDQFVGYLFYKDLLALAWEQKLLVLQDLIRPALVIPPAKRATELLHEMRVQRTQLAFVADEAGGLSGIVTLDDLIEELVGEVFGEARQTEPASMHREADGSIVALGTVPIRAVNREFDLDLPENEQWSTLGGLCMALARGVPETGARFRVNDSTHVVVEAVEGTAAARVRVVIGAIPPVERVES